MNLTFEAGIPVFTVFIQGVLSFLSPCVFPLVPLYIGYLAGGTLNVDEQGRMVYGDVPDNGSVSCDLSGVPCH